MTDSIANLYPFETNKQGIRITNKSNTNIEHQPWFHYKIQRKIADLLVNKNGDFLVRESISQLGSYTLVVHWADETINFLISCTIGGDGRPQYRFTSDSFSTIAEVIWYHVNTGCPVSEASPAVLLYPVDRDSTSRSDNTSVLSSTSSGDTSIASSSLDSTFSPVATSKPDIAMSRCHKGKNITSSLSPSYFSPSHSLDSYVSDTQSTYYLQIMAVVKSILFSSKAVYIPQNLQQYTPLTLAIHLTRTDLLVTQLSADMSTPSDRLRATGLQRLLMPYNESIQREAWFRHSQTKYLVILAVFGAANLESRTTLISQLISVARELSTVSLGNAFSFMSVMEALMSPQVANLSSTWCTLREKYSVIMTVFDLQLKPLALSYHSGSYQYPPVIPYIQPVLYNLLMTVQDVQTEDSSQREDLESGLDAFLNHFEAAKNYSTPNEALSKLQHTVNTAKEDSTLIHFLQQNHIKTLLNKIDKRFQSDWELYDCAEKLTTILSSLMTDY
ncbi:SH2 domain-containing protein 3C isoform X1 [Oopsacas minuta]|uniref:SH2 domain-containing protein 3C isoform X1 n=1 Tax=Oopsacas minuta TaxID=111878 RepID=A0AAV7K3W1_9METZ|nr:SH2 domain-containing protein 3C isoform X1 [Oopsacas minuta]